MIHAKGVMMPCLKHRCRKCLRSTILVCALVLGGCQWFVDSADREVYRLIEQRQLEALGESRNVDIDREKVPIAIDKEAYDFVPHPIDSKVPDSFKRPASRSTDVFSLSLTPPAASQPALENGADSTAPTTMPATQPAEPAATSQPATQPALPEDAAPVMTLVDALAYAFANSREFQFAKEDLYLQALALTLERHLWTPRLINDIQTQYANYGQIRNFDHAMAAVARVGVEQKLPLGGEVTATVVDNLMRDLTHHVSTAETGAIILEANIPLLRGAGLPAYESRFQAERDLIYAARAFEHFRRALAVDIANDYFNLQVLRQAALNAGLSIKTFDQEAAKARGLRRPGWIIGLEVQRAEQALAGAIIQELDAREAYQTGLDAFKIRLGMPVSNEINVAWPDDPADSGPGAPATDALQSQPADFEAGTLSQDLRMPAVSQEEAIRVAYKYRLDLLNQLDSIDDTARKVKVAENHMLPDLNASGSVRMDTDPSHLSTLDYNTERTTWRAALDLVLPLDRKAEQTVLRSALILKRRAERTYAEAKDTVALQVRRAIRRVDFEQASLRIQIANRDLALQRRRLAQFEFQKGRASNREIFDAEDELLEARNRLAQAQSRMRLAILQFRRDTGTLRIDDEGRWDNPVVKADEKG